MSEVSLGDLDDAGSPERGIPPLSQSPRRAACSPDTKLKGDALTWHSGIREARSDFKSPIIGRIGGYTSPRVRSSGRSKQAGLLSSWDAAWEGDTAGLHAILARSDDPKVEIDKLGVLQAFCEGLRFDPNQPLKGFHRTLDCTPNARYPRFHATPLMWAIASRKLQTVQYLLEHEASPTITADLGNGLTPSSAKHIVFVTTFFHCQTAAEARASRMLKGMVYSKLPDEGLTATKDMTEADIVDWVSSCNLAVKHSVYGQRFDPALWVKRHRIDGVKMQTWLASDWRNIGIHRLKDLQKLLLKLVPLIDGGHKAPVDKAAKTSEEKDATDGDGGDGANKEDADVGKKEE